MIYMVHPTRAISETLDNETIIINLETGAYYNMNDTGSVVWEYLRAGSSPEVIIEALGRHYSGSPADIAESVQTIITELVAEGLIQETTTQGDAPSLDLPAQPQPFSAPQMNRFDDMQAMLLADPVHDVDESGWPVLKNDAS